MNTTKVWKVATLVMLMLACFAMALIAGMSGHENWAGLLLVAALGNGYLATTYY